MEIEVTSPSLAGAEPEKNAFYKEIQRPPFSATEKPVSRSRFFRRAPRFTRRNFSSRANELSGAMRSSFRFQKADARGFEHFFALTFANFMVASSRSSRSVTTNQAFLA